MLYDHLIKHSLTEYPNKPISQITSLRQMQIQDAHVLTEIRLNLWVSIAVWLRGGV